jgi:hypothetical protein
MVLTYISYFIRESSANPVSHIMCKKVLTALFGGILRVVYAMTLNKLRCRIMAESLNYSRLGSSTLGPINFSSGGLQARTKM